MNNFFFTRQQWKVFAEDLLKAFVNAGFEIVENPSVDSNLFGFRATYIRRYVLHRPTYMYNEILTTLVHVIGLPFGCQSKKMIILSAPRSLKGEQISETLKLRVHFDENDLPYVVHGEQPTADAGANTSVCHNQATSNEEEEENNSNQLPKESLQESICMGLSCKIEENSNKDLEAYVSQIIEAISPGLIELPTEMKVEILKKLSVDSIIKMSRVNNEFRSIIFQHGESLWRHLCYRDFKLKSINRMIHRSWLELYRETFILHQIEICRMERALPGLPERPALPPAPYRLQIGWLPEVLQLPYNPIHDVVEVEHEHLQLALDFHPLRRADSLDSIQ